MKKAIVTITIGDFYTKLSKLTHPLIKQYADKVGAEFVVISESKHKYPHYAKCDLMQMFDNYDRILYIDTDIIIRPDSPNLFDLVSNEQFAIFEEGRFTPRLEGFLEYLKYYGIKPSADYGGAYYNTGVFLASKKHRKVFRKPAGYDNHFYEQSYLNMNLLIDKVDIHSLSYKFNRMCALDMPTGEHRLASYFVHYAGLNVALAEPAYFDLIQKDIEEWSQGNYHPGYNICIAVGGGFGDRVSAEPTVRYLCEHLYKDDNVVVLCETPEIFRHINRPVYTTSAEIPDYGKYYLVRTLHPTMENEPIYRYISPLLIHASNLASINTTRMELPLDHRNVKLELDPTALNKFHELLNEANTVALHLGTSWKSKTIPADIWNSYIEKLVSMGISPVLFGKDIADDFRGVNNEVKADGCLDLRNQLSFDEMMALVAKVPVLISNDSVPVHIAGAFDNWIGIIATCKHPDYILPHRRDPKDPSSPVSIYYKAKNLEKIPMYYDYERRPNFVDGSRVDDCRDERLRECLPTAQDIENFVREVLLG